MRVRQGLLRVHLISCTIIGEAFASVWLEVVENAGEDCCERVLWPPMNGINADSNPRSSLLLTRPKEALCADEVEL